MRNHEDTMSTKDTNPSRLKIATPLSDDLEALAYDVIGCCVAVHRILGPGLLETVYAQAVRLEMKAQGIPFEAEKAIPVRYREILLCHQRLDLFVAGQIVLELKSVEHLSAIHVAQILSYLRVAKVRLGLLVNFNVYQLKDGIRRVIL